MNAQAIREFLETLFTTDAGKTDYLMILACAVALVYAVLILLMPFALWRMRRESIRTRKLLSALLESRKTTEHILCAIADEETDQTACLRRVTRAVTEAAMPETPRKNAARPAPEKRTAPAKPETEDAHG